MHTEYVSENYLLILQPDNSNMTSFNFEKKKEMKKTKKKKLELMNKENALWKEIEELSVKELKTDNGNLVLILI